MIASVIATPCEYSKAMKKVGNLNHLVGDSYIQ